AAGGNDHGPARRLAPEDDVSATDRHAYEHSVRAGPGMGRGRASPPGAAGPNAPAGAGLVPGGPGLPGTVRAIRRGLPLAGAVRGRVDEPIRCGYVIFGS